MRAEPVFLLEPLTVDRHLPADPAELVVAQVIGMEAPVRARDVRMLERLPPKEPASAVAVM